MMRLYVAVSFARRQLDDGRLDVQRRLLAVTAASEADAYGQVYLGCRELFPAAAGWLGQEIELAPVDQKLIDEVAPPAALSPRRKRR